MKKLFFILVLIFSPVIVFADDCTISCPSESLQIIEKENLATKVTGVNFFTKKIIEFVIEKELKDELESKFNADLELFTVGRLKKGEFKTLTLTSTNFRYRALSVSDFIAETVCPYNKIVYQNKKVYYPYELPFKFSGKITNNDIKNTIDSYEFQRTLEKSALRVNNFTSFRVLEPKITIKNNKLNFEIPIKTFLSKEPTYFNVSSDIAVDKNEIVLKDTTFSSKSNIINIDLLGGLVNKINPVAFQNTTINSKYCKLNITNAKIENNQINVDGMFIINQNYGRVNE